MMISNSSPLIHLTKLGKIGFLLEKEEIMIPFAVFQEILIGKDKNYAESYIIEELIKKDKIMVEKIGEFDKSLYPFLGNGEIEAIELTRQKGLPLIIDDQKARNIATFLKLKYQTTINTIFELLIRNDISLSEYKSNLKKLAEDSWISTDVIQEYIDKGEQYGK